MSRRIAPPPTKALFDSGNFNLGKLVWCPSPFFAINRRPPVIVLASAFGQIFVSIIPKTSQQKCPFEHQRAMKNRQGVGNSPFAVIYCSRLAVSRRLWCVVSAHGDTAPWLQPDARLVHSLHLARFRRVVRKLEITPSGAVPLGHREIVLIGGL
jgi:hypothetical protein